MSLSIYFTLNALPRKNVSNVVVIRKRKDIVKLVIDMGAGF
jgi:hypothetical protein